MGDLFGTHGGLNHLSDGRYYGVPLVIVPQPLEPGLTGRHVARHGAGLVLGDPPPYGRLDPQSLRTAVHRILGDATFVRNAKAIGRTLREVGGSRRAADSVDAALR